jgi:hypothetical protein
MSGRKPKASKATMLLRLTEIWRIRLDGAAYLDIAEYIAEESKKDGSPWKLAEGEKPLSRRSIENYIQRVDAMIAASTKESRKRALRRHLARREALYAKAVGAGDVRAALAVLDSDAKLRNLFPADKHEVAGKNGEQLFHPGPAAAPAILADVQRALDEFQRGPGGVPAAPGQRPAGGGAVVPPAGAADPGLRQRG